ncbi:MAG TPA: DHH family phosphoesterase, partial [Phycisphaerales bacterium]|nr:DHH family phosphoesterase [Phycisphaerales bacterium]
MDASGVYREGAGGGTGVAKAPGVALGRGLKKRWRLRSACAEGGGGTLADVVLAARGLAGDRAGRFLSPSLMHLHPPELLPDVDKAAERLLRALRGGEPIAIYGDYDVDGVTATAVLYHTLVHLAAWMEASAVIRTYVPHRLDEGYGLHGPAIALLASEGAKVIVSVDCGVTAVEPARVAKAAGVDLIITDHHNPPATEEALPEAYAVVHPRRPGSRYPRSDLCGAGVAYKLAWRMCTMAQGERLNKPTRELLVNLLAFAALGTIADVVPLGGSHGQGDENRIIASFGLTRVRSSPFVGLRALSAASGLTNPKVDEWDVGFKLAPRLNASGRMNHARDAVELFTVAGEGRAAEIAAALEEANKQRRSVEAAIVSQAAEMAEKAGMTGRERRAIVLAHRDWHAGVVGICCSRLVEKYCRPVLLMQLTEHEGALQAHGSGRSVDGFSLHDGLHACAPMLMKFGGHDMAAGLRVDAARLESFTEAFIAHANG